MLKNFKSVKSTDENGNILYKAYNLGLTDEEYDALKPVIGFLNGCWREKEKCFVFGYNPDEILKDMFEMWESGFFDKGTSVNYSESADGKLPLALLPFKYREWQESNHFFPTPDDLAKRVVELCEIGKDDIVLEPSAGQGGLLKHIPNCKRLIPIEKDAHNVKVLNSKGHGAIRASFEDAVSGGYVESPTKVVMNPPFFGQLDIKHILLAYDIMQDGGTLVAIMSENNLYYETELTREFRKFLEDVGAEVISVPFGEFSSSGTMVYTVIIKIVKVG